MDTKRKTIGIDPKVPAQFIASAIVWAVAHYAGIDLSLEVEVAIAAIVGALIGVVAPAAKTVPVTNGVATVEGGTSHTRVT
jgi:hypothetical protein